MSGLTADDAAHKLAVKLERLEAWERGDSHPTISQLRRLADVYKRPLAAFFLPAAPADEPLPKDFRRFAPDALALAPPELRIAVRAAHVRRQALLELYQELDETPPAFKLKARLHEDPEQVGTRVRDALSPQFPTTDGRIVFNAWRTAAEEAGLLVFQADAIALTEMRGLSLSEHPLPVVVLNIQDAYQARTFTLLHEVAHIALGNGGMCLLDESGPNTPIQRTEVFCNHVAGAAVVPASLLLQELETPKRAVDELADDVLVTLARRYGVSSEVIARRLLTLGRVSAAFYQRKRIEFQQRYERLRSERSPGFAPPGVLAVARNGRTFTRRVLDAYDEERITTSDLADLLGVRLKHLDRIRRAVQSPAESEEEAA